MTDKLPDWLQALTNELGLDDTPILGGGDADDDNSFTSLLDVVKNIEFTAEGWAHIKKMIVNDDSVSKIPLFQRILGTSSDDTMMFTVMIAIPYGLAKMMGYDSKRSERLINYFTAAFVISMSRGYDLGQQDAAEERQSRDE